MSSRCRIVQLICSEFDFIVERSFRYVITAACDTSFGSLMEASYLRCHPLFNFELAVCQMLLSMRKRNSDRSHMAHFDACVDLLLRARLVPRCCVWSRQPQLTTVRRLMGVGIPFATPRRTSHASSLL